MAYDYYELLAQARSWIERVYAEGRLNHEQTQAINAIDLRSSEALFSAERDQNPARPLIVAFMGGTGVGKSSLLNRLAGQPIARAGVERPTSREVTLYHHQSLAIQHLPAGLPLDSVKISRHNDIGNSNIVWVDMPDFDSIELGNQRMVLEWLPHIDVLLYVVSPERYRDNKAWQLLLAEGLKHAWLFVMNQWDIGSPVQYEDFKQQLQKAGFENPLVFRTSCAEPRNDEFTELLRQIQTLSEQHCVAQLEQRNRRQRWQQLKLILEQWQNEISARDFQQLHQSYADIRQKNETTLLQGLAWPLQEISRFWSEQPGKKPDIKLWDDWAQSRFNDSLDELALQAAQFDITSKPLKTGLQNIKNQAEKKVSLSTELAARQALLNPGNGLQRFFLELTAISETLLPLVAMTVVGYQVFSGYYHSANDVHAYLGLDFAIHSIMLIGLSWLIPFFLHKKIQPSMQNNALKGLQKGLQQALTALDTEIEALLQTEQNCNIVLQQELTALIEHCEPDLSNRVEKGSLLGRMLCE